MDTSNKLAVGAALSLGLFGAINLLGATVFSSSRMDLTEEKLYTLSEGAKDIARSLDETVRLELYASKELRDASPVLNGFVGRVEGTLENFVRASDGKIVLERFDPEEFSEAEDEAALNGLQRVGVGGASGYLGLVMRNSFGDKEVIRALTPAEEIFIEYEVAQRLVALDAADLPVVGIMSDLGIDGGPPMAQGQPPQPAWQLRTLLERTAQVRTIPTSATAIEDDVDVLLLVHPRGLSEATLYAIDQFALAGGRLVALLDPSCVVDIGAQQAGELPPPSSLDPLLAAWGVEFSGTDFVADRLLAPQQEGSAGLLEIPISSEQVDSEDPIAARLSDMRFITAGAFTAIEGASTTLAPLVTTTEEAGLLRSATAFAVADPAELRDDFLPAYRTFTIAARLRGPITTAFPEGPAVDAPASEEGGETEQAPTALPDGHLAESTSDFEAILIGDVDMVHEAMWTQRTMFGTQKVAENIDFVLNAVDQLGGSEALMSLRARGTFARPFEVVEALRVAAGEELEAERSRLEKELEDINARIQEIAAEQGGGTTVLLTPELEEELDKAYAKRDETRKELRRVRFDLERDEEALGRRVKALNVLGMPLVVIASGILVWLRRRGRANA